MFAFTLLALAGAAFAAPARRTNYGGCDLSAVTLNPPEGYDFPAPSGAPKFVTVGGGTQNYTCGADGKYAYVFYLHGRSYMLISIQEHRRGCSAL